LGLELDYEDLIDAENDRFEARNGSRH
jgi:hypothetical protein